MTRQASAKVIQTGGCFTLFSRRWQTSDRAIGLCAAFAVLLSAGTQTRAAAPDINAVKQQVASREAQGDLPGARALLDSAGAAGDPAALAALAIFLDRHLDDGRRSAFLKWAASEPDPARKRMALRQAVLTDFTAGNHDLLKQDVRAYEEAGGSDLAIASGHIGSSAYKNVLMPGPLASFARMAALAPELDPADLLPSLARNVVTGGYQAAANETLQQTEYLKLLLRYLSEAQELQALANQDHKIVIPACDSEQTGNLLKVLGYRMRGSCGADIALETVNPSRAFVTIDSGFPLAQLERDLRADHRFELEYAPTAIPVLYDPAYWQGALNRPGSGSFIEDFVSDPALCRLYLGLSRLDPAVSQVVRKQMTPDRLRVYANVLDFYGGMFQVENGVAVVPGSAHAWGSLVGASPQNPGAFFEKILTTDDGWLAGYFDALIRLPEGPTRTYLTQPERLRRFYEALRGKITSPGPARPVFRATTDLMLLTTSLRLDPSGSVHVPGDLAVWKTLIAKHPHEKGDAKLSRAAGSWRSSDDLIEALFALSRKNADNQPLRIFLTLNDIDRWRSQPLSAATTSRLIAEYRVYGSQYRVLTDAPGLSEQSIARLLEVCADLDGIKDPLLRSDATGSAQALIEMFSILARQNVIPVPSQDVAFAKVTGGFDDIHDSADIFTASHAALTAMFSAAGISRTGTMQATLTEVLVGPPHSPGEALPSPAERFARIFDAQELVPLDALFTIQSELGKGKLDPAATRIINAQMERLRETETLHDSLSTEEKSASATEAYWSGRHLAVERKLDLEALAKDPDRKDARQALGSLLRDSLLGFVYCYYAPPGAQILMTNPMFVRNHDFTGFYGAPSYWASTDVSASGWPSNQGGRLNGSLSNLAYALAEAEQNFLTPKRRQALIWGDLAPQMMISVTVPHWRQVTSVQLRYVSLRMARGNNLLAAAAMDPNLMRSLRTALERHLTPGEVRTIEDRLVSGDFRGAALRVPPAVLYEIAEDPALQDAPADIYSMQLASLNPAARPELEPAAMSRAFGTPKPTLFHSYRPTLMGLRTFPALMGYSSRILAETWESNNLYFAAVADEAGVPPDMLDCYVPEWNREILENIFAANLEDWPSLIRSLRTTGDSILRQPSQLAQAGEGSGN